MNEYLTKNNDNINTHNPKTKLPPTSMRETIKNNVITVGIIPIHTGKKIPIKISGRRPGDAVSCIVDELSRHCNLTRTLEDMCLDQYNLEINNCY